MCVYLESGKELKVHSQLPNIKLIRSSLESGKELKDILFSWKPLYLWRASGIRKGIERQQHISHSSPQHTLYLESGKELKEVNPEPAKNPLSQIWNPERNWKSIPLIASSRPTKSLESGKELKGQHYRNSASQPFPELESGKELKEIVEATLSHSISLPLESGKELKG